MDSIHPNPARRLKEALAVMAAGILLCSALAWLDLPQARESVTRDSIALQLIAGATEGRQALVGSVWWAPLPSLLRVPLQYALQFLPHAGGGLLFASLCAVALLWLMYRFCRLRLARMESAYLILALLLAPGFAEPVLYGADHYWNLLLVFALLTAYHAWRREHSLRALVLFGSTMGMITISGIDILAWAVIVFGLLAVHELARRASAAEKRATLLLAALPALYAAGLWMLMNWLIMGAPLFFLRTLSVPDIGSEMLIPNHMAAGMMVWLVYLLLISLMAILTRNAAALCLVAATMVWVLPLNLFANVGLTSMEFSAWLALTIGALLATAVMAGSLDRRRMRLRLILCLLPVALVVAMRSPRLPLQPPAIRMAIDQPGQRHALLAAVGSRVTRVEKQHVKVFVAGFEALFLLKGYDGDLFQPVLDFDVQRTVRDYHGYRLYLLIHRPDGLAALDPIHVKYPGIYRHGGALTLYDSDYGPWRLYEITPKHIPPEVLP